MIVEPKRAVSRSSMIHVSVRGLGNSSVGHKSMVKDCRSMPNEGVSLIILEETVTSQSFAKKGRTG